jgi:hypothetical protein
MCQNTDVWHFLENGRDMDLCRIFTTRFAAGRDMDSKVDNFLTLKLYHAKTANLIKSESLILLSA